MRDRDELLARIDQLERSVAAEVAAAEERGRRRGLEETKREVINADRVIACLVRKMGGEVVIAPQQQLTVDGMTIETSRDIDGSLRIRALAPRDSAPVCNNCKRAQKASDGRTEASIEIGPCYCDKLRAPRDSGEESFFAHDEPSQIPDGTFPLSEDSE